MNINNEIELSENAHCIRILECFTQKEYKQINMLMKLCCEHDKVNLKLELDCKLHLHTIADKRSNSKPAIMNEFLYYVNEELVSYLGVSCFDGKTGEITGMTHPEWREKGLFHRLLALALNECKHNKFSNLLLLSDGNSKSGMHFLETSESTYAHSEYRMKRSNNLSPTIGLSVNTAAIHNDVPAVLDTIKLSPISVTLRLACKSDQKEITRQNTIYFDDEEIKEETEDYEATSLEDKPENYKTYMVELDKETIGKINVDYSDNHAFLCGFGILPDYRGKGYGKAALKEALRIIEDQDIEVTELDVVCTNSNALNLYKSCGFEEMSIMNYYNLYQKPFNH